MGDQFKKCVIVPHQKKETGEEKILNNVGHVIVGVLDGSDNPIALVFPSIEIEKVRLAAGQLLPGLPIETDEAFFRRKAEAARPPQKYKIDQRVRCGGWGGQKDCGIIKDIKWIFHNRLQEHTWGYRIAWEGDGPGLAMVYIPEGYLEAAA